jgi:hypothetical protein
MKKMFTNIAKLVGFAAVAYIGLSLFFGVFFWSDFQDVAYGDDAIAMAKTKDIFVPDHAQDVFYSATKWQNPDQHVSFTLPKAEAAAYLKREVAKHCGPQELISGSQSAYSPPEHGPRKPKEWKDQHWNTTKLGNALMYEEQYKYFCVDLDTGRVYISFWLGL